MPPAIAAAVSFTILCSSLVSLTTVGFGRIVSV
jgi:hypothetical protein